MNKIIEEEKTTYIMFAFDKGKTYFPNIYEEDACEKGGETGGLNYNFFKYGNDTYIFRFRLLKQEI